MIYRLPKLESLSEAEEFRKQARLAKLRCYNPNHKELIELAVQYGIEHAYLFSVQDNLKEDIRKSIKNIKDKFLVLKEGLP
jgi:hypothetical protein